jgi:hypothetical protein
MIAREETQTDVDPSDMGINAADIPDHGRLL